LPYVAWGPVDWCTTAKPRPLIASVLAVFQASGILSVDLVRRYSRALPMHSSRDHFRAMLNGYFFFDVVQIGASWCRMNRHESEEYPPYPSPCPNYDFCST
jgi:hypothetical protein